MGKVIELSDYRKRAPAAPEMTYRVEWEAPFLLVRRFLDGVFVGEKRVIPELMLRDLLDGMP
jgi:hypothetical protein